MVEGLVREQLPISWPLEGRETRKEIEKGPETRHSPQSYALMGHPDTFRCMFINLLVISQAKQWTIKINHHTQIPWFCLHLELWSSHTLSHFIIVSISLSEIDILWKCSRLRGEKHNLILSTRPASGCLGLLSVYFSRKGFLYINNLWELIHLDLQKSCKGNTENFRTPFTRLSLLLTEQGYLCQN